MILTDEYRLLAAPLELNQASPTARRDEGHPLEPSTSPTGPSRGPREGRGGASHTSRRASLTDILPWSSSGAIGDKSWLIG